MSTDLAVLAHTPGADPRAILVAACARPMDVGGQRTEYDPTLPAALGGGQIAPGAGGLTIPDGRGGLVNRVTPEQLLAIVASLIASAPDAQTACVRLRAEVVAWRFEDRMGRTI